MLAGGRRQWRQYTGPSCCCYWLTSAGSSHPCLLLSPATRYYASSPNPAHSSSFLGSSSDQPTKWVFLLSDSLMGVLQAVEADCNTLGALLKAMLGLLSKPQAAANLFAQEAQLSASTSTEADTAAVAVNAAAGALTASTSAEADTAVATVDAFAAAPTASTSTAADTAAAIVAATAGAMTAATGAGGDQPMDAETVEGSKQVVDYVRSGSLTAQPYVCESAEGCKSAVESKDGILGVVQSDIAEDVMPGNLAAAPKSLVAMEMDSNQLAPFLNQAEIQANELKPELKHDVSNAGITEGQLGATDVPSTLLNGSTPKGHLASAVPLVPSALGAVPVAPHVVPFGTGAGPSSLAAGPSSLAAGPSSLGAGPSSSAAAPTEQSQSAVTASLCKAHIDGRQLAGATHTPTEQHPSEGQAEPLETADLPVEKAAAHGRRVSNRGKEGKCKGGLQEQSLVAKPQLTGRAALALAVMEAGGNYRLLPLLLQRRLLLLLSHLCSAVCSLCPRGCNNSWHIDIHMSDAHTWQRQVCVVVAGAVHDTHTYKYDSYIKSHPYVYPHRLYTYISIYIYAHPYMLYTYIFLSTYMYIRTCGVHTSVYMYVYVYVYLCCCLGFSYLELVETLAAKLTLLTL